MSQAMTATQFVAQLKKWGIPYKVPYAGWATHNRGNRGDGWGDMHGVIQHHTGSDTTPLSYLYNGDRALPGPLCHVGNDSQGVLHLIGWGRANHAGGGDPNVLNHVIREDYTGILKPHYHEGQSGAVDGNARFYGIESIYSGSHGMTPAQYHTALRFGAAICDWHDWTAKSVIGHGEWSDWKTDPGYAPGRMMDMNAFRNDTAHMLASGPKAK